MLKGDQDSEPFWKALLSWQMALAVVLIGVLFFALKNSERIAMVSGEVTDANLPDMPYCREQVLTDVDNMEASRLYKEGRFDDALRAAKRLYKSNPYDVKTLLCYGNIFAQVGEPKEEGYQCLRRAMALAPHSRYVRLDYARQLAAGKRYEEAIAQYEILVKAFPVGWNQPRAELAQILMENRQYDKAVEQFKSLLEDPSNATNGQMRKWEGIALAANGDPEGGFAEFIRGARMEQAQGFSANAKAAVGVNGGDANRAIEALQKKISDEPEQAVAHTVTLAQIYMGLNNLDQAKRLLLEGKEKEDTNPEVHRALAEVLDRQNDPDGAKSEFKIATQSDLHPAE